LPVFQKTPNNNHKIENFLPVGWKARSSIFAQLFNQAV